MISGGSSIGGTITNGVQDLAALLPLLGTEQCEYHVGSALKKGFLYAAAAPLSLFGSLGVARAGFKTLLSAISIPRLKFDGAKTLAAAGFKPEGTNLSLIMLDEEEDRYCCEKRLKLMMEELHVEDSNKISVSSKTHDWNIQMTLATAISCIISITPYIHLNLHDPNTLNHFVRWAFPIIRAIGGFLTATMIQLVIQNRLLAIMRKRLILDGLGEEKQKGLNINGKEPYLTLDQRFSALERYTLSSDLEPGLTAETAGKDKENLQRRIKEANGSSVLRWTFLVLLFVGIIASVVGYVGCFSAVQGSGSSKEALIWLCLEAGLSIIRIVLWAINPEGDDAPPLEFKFKLDEHPPLPTCCKSADEIEESKVLPLVRATDFLQEITSYTGPLPQFSRPSLTLYYTLTRRFHVTPDSFSSERVLYITIFDHTERTTRVYSERVQDGNTTPQSYFYSADSVAIDLHHGIVTTMIGGEIQPKDDPIAGDSTLRPALTDHYHSILDRVNSRIKFQSSDTLENNWTLQLREAESLTQKGTRKDGSAEDGEGSLDWERDNMYLGHGAQERKVRDLIPVRGKWVEDYTDWLHQTIDGDLALLKEVYHNEVEKYELEVVELLLIQEWAEMEMMLVDEVHAWKEKLREHRPDVLKWFVSNGGLDQARRAELEKRWRADLWEQLDGRSAMADRMAAAESRFLQRVTNAGKKGADETQLKDAWTKLTSNIRDAWGSLFNNIESTAIASPPPPSPGHDRLKKALDSYREDLEYRMQEHDVDETVRRRCRERIRKRDIRLESEVQDVDERLANGLEHCHQFWSGSKLVDLTHSDSKWLRIVISRDGAIRALSRNKHVILIEVYARSASSSDITEFFAAIRNTTSCTSIFGVGGSIPGIELPPNILSISHHYGQLSSEHENTLALNRSQLDKRTTIEFSDIYVTGRDLTPVRSGSSFTLRFFGPSSDYLTLRLIHRSAKAEQFLQVVSSAFTHPIPQSDSYVLEDIRIMPQDATSSSGLTFEPGTRNTLAFTCGLWEYFRDIELLDKDGFPYRSADAAQMEVVSE